MAEPFCLRAAWFRRQPFLFYPAAGLDRAAVPRNYHKK